MEVMSTDSPASVALFLSPACLQLQLVAVMPPNPQSWQEGYYRMGIYPEYLLEDPL